MPREDYKKFLDVLCAIEEAEAHTGEIRASFQALNVSTWEKEEESSFLLTIAELKLFARQYRQMEAEKLEMERKVDQFKDGVKELWGGCF